MLDDTLYEYDYTTGELTATGLADRQSRTVTDALPPDPYEGRGAFDVTITRILNGQLVVEYYSNDWTNDNAETKTPVYLVDLAAGTVAEKPALPPLNWNGYDHTSTTILAQLQDRLLGLRRTGPYKHRCWCSAVRSHTPAPQPERTAHPTRFNPPTAILG